MTFSDAVRTCLKVKYATFQGRASRSEYWWFMLFIYGVSLILGGLALALGGARGFETGDMPVFAIILFILAGVFFLGMILPMIAVTVRRFHDYNLSGWWYLAAIVVGMVPFVGFAASIAAFVITVLKGTVGDNRFGPDPLLPATSADIFA